MHLFCISFHACIHFFHTLGTMHEISVGEGSNLTNITKKKKNKEKIYIKNFLKGVEQYFDIFFVRN